MKGPLQVYRLHPNSLKEAECLRVMWKDGKLTVFYGRYAEPASDEMYIQEWKIECAEPRVIERRHRSANLVQYLNELESGS